MSKTSAAVIAQSRAVLDSCKSEANSPKHRLMDLMHRLERTESPHTRRKAAQLRRIIWRLEDWQNAP